MCTYALQCVGGGRRVYLEVRVARVQTLKKYRQEFKGEMQTPLCAKHETSQETAKLKAKHFPFLREGGEVLHYVWKPTKHARTAFGTWRVPIF